MSSEIHASTVNPTQQVLQLATGYILSTALYLVARLNIADQLAAGLTTSVELAQATGADEGALYRVMRLLTSCGLFKEVSPKQFTLTPRGRSFSGMSRARCTASLRSCPIRFTTGSTPARWNR